ncbi:hypothetical protein Ddc_24639 [Ditylenchus destructor]|nr:hypothetical protein Ddc_24639 [Ditylenchus destructor]
MKYSIFIFCILVAVVCGAGNNGLCDKGSTKTDSLKPVCSKYARFDNDGLNATEACSMALAYVTCVHEITAMTCGAEFANKALKGPHDKSFFIV